MREFCNHLFDSSTDGYIHVLKLSNKDYDKRVNMYNTKYDGLREVVNSLKNQSDVFIAPNTMYIPRRRVENIRQFRALFQDLDCEKIGYGKEETFYLLWELCCEGKIPKPTMVTDSGRGIHVYWRVKNAPYGALKTWQELEDYLYHHLRHLGADRQATDSSRVLRLPGTINSRNKANCELLYINKKLEYSMYDLREEFLNYKSSSDNGDFKENKLVSSRVIKNKFFNSYSLHMQRANDLKTLCRLRGYDVKGYRNMIIHCYAYWMGIYIRDGYELEKDVNELNNLFLEPLKDSEINAILRCVPKAIDKFISYEQGLRSGERKRVSKGMRDKDGYWYKNSTLIDRLGITLSEQRFMKTIITTKEKYYRKNKKRTPRNENGLTKKQQELEDFRENVIYLKDKGTSLRNISKELNISLGKVQRLVKNRCIEKWSL